MLNFKPELLKTDVLCVKLIDNYVLAGIGNFLYIYALSSSKFIERLEIFNGTKICGVVPNKSNNKLIIYGETKLKIIFFDVPTIDFTVISDCKSELVGWTLAAKWVENDSRIVTVSMNNTASLWNLKFDLLLTISCAEKCIAYCADIANVNDNWDDLVILTGTVFSDLLIWRTTSEEDNLCAPVRRLKAHKGVVFSICYNEINNLICTTSDDRSTIVWKVYSKNLLNAFKNADVIEQKLILHGHDSRIFNCQLTDNFVLSAGEDGLVNIWNLDGELCRKIESHQGVNVWSVFCSEKENIVISGGSDCSVNASSLDIKVVTKILASRNNSIKKVSLLNDGKVIAVVENGSLYLFDLCKDNLIDSATFIDQLECMKSYAILETSPCKNFCAIGGFRGDIVIYYHNNLSELTRLTSYQIRHKPRIFSIHWLSSQKLLTCVNEGFIFIWYLREDQLFLEDIKQLPPTRERFTTCACALNDDFFVVGDRKGNIYVYNKDNIGPVQYLKKAHNFMGVTNLYFTQNRLISMGKDSMMKQYSVTSEIVLQDISRDKLPFSWLIYYYASISESRILLAGFKGDNLVIFDYTNRSVVFETKCGGGHRSWDILCNDKALLVSYIKDKSVHTIEITLRNILATALATSYQSKEINALTSIKYDEGYLLISGGEDTTLRIHKLVAHNKLSEVFISKSHLSNIRAICSYKTDKDRFYIFSGGGRAQIIFWELCVGKGDVLCVQRDSYHEALEENRIMDICAYKFGEMCCHHVFAGCSDGNIKVFQVNSSSSELKFEGNMFYDVKCILRLTICRVVVNHYLLTMATDGLVVLWDINSIVYKTWDESKHLKLDNLKPHQSFAAHSSGINSISYCIFALNGILFATGGDDNKVSIDLVEFTRTQKNFHKNIASDALNHCAQITGVFISHNILITASIDQKIIAYQWDGRNVNLDSAVRYNSSVADIQGMRILNFNENNSYPKFDTSLQYPLRIVVYGKGIEILTLK